MNYNSFILKQMAWATLNYLKSCTESFDIETSNWIPENLKAWDFPAGERVAVWVHLGYALLGYKIRPDLREGLIYVLGFLTAHNHLQLMIHNSRMAFFPKLCTKQNLSCTFCWLQVVCVFSVSSIWSGRIWEKKLAVVFFCNPIFVCNRSSAHFRYLAHPGTQG